MTRKSTPRSLLGRKPFARNPPAPKSRARKSIASKSIAAKSIASSSKSPRSAVESAQASRLGLFKFVTGVSLLLSIAGAFFLSRRYGLSLDLRDGVTAWLQGLGPWAAPGFVLLFAAAAVVAIPGTALAALAVFCFGFARGAALSLAGACGGAALAFFFARTFGRPWVERQLTRWPRLEEIDRRLGSEGARAVFLLRLLPGVPYNVLNWLCGLSSLRFGPYLLASGLGMIPGTLLYCWAAAAAGRAIATGGSRGGRQLALAVLVLALVLGLGAFTAHRTRRGQNPDEPVR